MTTPAPRIEAQESRWQRWAVRLLPALTFVLGIGLGSVLVLAGDTGRPAPGAGEGPSAGPSDAGDPAAVGDDTVVTVPGACEDAAENLTEATGLVEDVAAAVREFRPEELVGLLDRLEDLDNETRPLAARCGRVDVSRSPAVGPSEAPTE